jgi:hypothetical protein
MAILFRLTKHRYREKDVVGITNNFVPVYKGNTNKQFKTK